MAQEHECHENKGIEIRLANSTIPPYLSTSDVTKSLQRVLATTS